MKANATTNKVNEIVERGFITESEINLLKNRVNNGRACHNRRADRKGPQMVNKSMEDPARR